MRTAWTVRLVRRGEQRTPRSARQDLNRAEAGSPEARRRAWPRLYCLQGSRHGRCRGRGLRSGHECVLASRGRSRSGGAVSCTFISCRQCFIEWYGSSAPPCRWESGSRRRRRRRLRPGPPAPHAGPAPRRPGFRASRPRIATPSSRTPRTPFPAWATVALMRRWARASSACSKQLSFRPGEQSTPSGRGRATRRAPRAHGARRAWKDTEPQSPSIAGVTGEITTPATRGSATSPPALIRPFRPCRAG